MNHQIRNFKAYLITGAAIGLASLPCQAAPLISQNFATTGLATSLNRTQGTVTSGQAVIPAIPPFFPTPRVTTVDTSVNNIGTAVRIPGATLAGDLGLPTNSLGSAIYSTVTGGGAAEFLAFNFAPTAAAGNQANHTFEFFASLVDNTTNVAQVLELTTAGTYDFAIPTSDTYTVGFGVLRSAPGVPGGSFANDASFTNIQGVGTPEIDSGSALTPLALSLGMLLLASERRRRRVSVS